MNIMKNKLLFTVARIQNCWEHHQDGSDLLRSYHSHLFCLVFNDLSHALRGDDFGPLRWFDEYEERSVQEILRDEPEFKKYWREINILEITHASIQTEDKGNSLIGKSHPEIFKKAPKGYFEKRGQTQGFLTSEHKFVDRIEAAKIAIAAGQISEDTVNGGILISENLWADSGFEYDPNKGYYKKEETLEIDLFHKERKQEEIFESEKEVEALKKKIRGLEGTIESCYKPWKRDAKKYLEILKRHKICPDCESIDKVCDCPFG